MPNFHHQTPNLDQPHQLSSIQCFFTSNPKFSEQSTHFPTYPIQSIAKFLLISSLTVLAVLLLSFFIHSQSIAFLFNSSPPNTPIRLLTENDIDRENSIYIPLSKDVVPRWYYYSNVEKSSSNLTNSTRKTKQLTLFYKNQPNQSNFNITPTHQVELIAGITNTMLEAARKQINSLQTSPNEKQFDQLAQNQYIYYEQKYHISQFKQLAFCIVVPTYNNALKSRYKLNIQSIIAQEYQNYHIVIIDDASTDATGNLIEKYLIEKEFPKEKYVLIKNEKQMRAMPNLRRAAKEFCRPEEIFIIVDGDDYLLGKQVFNLYNAIFQEKKVWFMYTNFVNLNTLTVGYSRPFPEKFIQDNLYRKYPFVTSHLRAFYTKLFLLIKEEDLQDRNGKYFESANDVAICFPILEMSHLHVIYIPEITYGYNSNTGINNHQLKRFEQITNEQTIRTKNPYSSLDRLFDQQPLHK